MNLLKRLTIKTALFLSIPSLTLIGMEKPENRVSKYSQVLLPTSTNTLYKFTVVPVPTLLYNLYPEYIHWQQTKYDFSLKTFILEAVTYGCPDAFFSLAQSAAEQKQIDAAACYYYKTVFYTRITTDPLLLEKRTQALAALQNYAEQSIHANAYLVYLYSLGIDNQPSLVQAIKAFKQGSRLILEKGLAYLEPWINLGVCDILQQQFKDNSFVLDCLGTFYITVGQARLKTHSSRYAETKIDQGLTLLKRAYPQTGNSEADPVTQITYDIAQSLAAEGQTELAVKYYTLNVERKHVPSIEELVLLHAKNSFGLPAEPRVKLIQKYIDMGAELGSVHLNRHLGMVYAKGRDRIGSVLFTDRIDHTKAKLHFKRIVDKDLIARCMLGSLALCKKKLKKAVSHFDQALNYPQINPLIVCQIYDELYQFGSKHYANECLKKFEAKHKNYPFLRSFIPVYQALCANKEISVDKLINLMEHMVSVIEQGAFVDGQLIRLSEDNPLFMQKALENLIERGLAACKTSIKKDKINAPLLQLLRIKQQLRQK